jgi:N-methylhydantoinase A
VTRIDWRSAPAEKKGGRRVVHFGSGHGTLESAICGRGDIGTEAMPGPVIVEEYDSTVVVPPDWQVRQPTTGFLMLERLP